MKRPDYVLMILIGIFVLFGFLMLSFATGPSAFVKYGDSYYFVKNQFLKGFLPGFFLFWLFYKLDYHLLRKHSNKIFFATIVLLLVIFIPGVGKSINGSLSWIKLPKISNFELLFQPSEIAKLGMIIFFAAWFEYRANNKNVEKKQTFIQFLFLLCIISFPVLKQPDIGTGSIMILIAFLMYFVAGAPLSYFTFIGALGVISLSILIKKSPDRFVRFLAFLDPSKDPQGIGYHIMQSLLAIGSGGWFGVGLGNSMQKFKYLPEVSADSIFAIICEELGFLFITLFILALGLFLVRSIKIAFNSPDLFGKFLATGIIGWIILQSFVNISAMLSLMPLTGVPLPFISYGGTALAILLASCGILLNISKWSKKY